MNTSIAGGLTDLELTPLYTLKLPFHCQKIAKNLKKMSSFWQFVDSQMAIFRRVRSRWMVVQ